MSGKDAQTHGRNSKVYVPILLDIFHRKYKEGDFVVRFTLDEVRESAMRLGVISDLRNAPDLVYRMKSRTKLPSEISDKGFRILKTVERGIYQLERAESTIIELPEGAIFCIEDKTPVPVRRLLNEDLSRIDEQGLLTIVNYCDLLSLFTGLKIYRLKSHARKSVSKIGQVEVDEIDVGVTYSSLNLPIIFPIEAKAAPDPLNWAQIANQVNFANQQFSGFIVRPIGIKVDWNSIIYIIEFTPEIEAKNLRIVNSVRYRLTLSTEQVDAINSTEQEL
jgi:hypothetical protein